MKPITIDEILDLSTYEKERAERQRRIIELKRPRRIGVGDRLTFVFENRDTVLFQIQEMLRVERIVDPEKIQVEIDVYNELIPGENELSATLLIEIPEMAQIRAALDRLIGVDEHVFLDVGDESIQARFDPKQFEDERISAVQYVRFPLGATLAAAFRDPQVPATLRVEHPNYRAATPLRGVPRASLAADLDED